MPSLSLIFKIHIPYQLQLTNHSSEYIDRSACRAMVNRLADECFLSANEIIARHITTYGPDFKVAFSISGTAIELLTAYRPDVINSFRVLADKGNIEFLGETYYNSLSWLHSPAEFARQVQKHRHTIQVIFGTEPRIFRNTELVYNNDLAESIAGLGFSGILTEGLEKILKGRHPNQVFCAKMTDEKHSQIAVLTRNARMSDDLAFRFDDPAWSEYPLTAGKFSQWLVEHPAETKAVTLFFSYDNFGVHKKKESGIFDFLGQLPACLFAGPGKWNFLMPSEIVDSYPPQGVYDVPETISWQDKNIENCVWSNNTSQHNALKKLYALEKPLQAIAHSRLTEMWRRLQSADHLYRMKADYPLRDTDADADLYARQYKKLLGELEIDLMYAGLKSIKKTNHKTTHETLY